MILYGASGHARVIRDIIEAIGECVDNVIDDNPSLKVFDNLPVCHSLTDIDCTEPQHIIISIGNNRVRKIIAERIIAIHTHLSFGVAIHPSAIISPSTTIDSGSVVMHGAILQAKSIIGKHCIVNTGASVDHECLIEDFVHISPHATLCGNVSVGEGAWIGAGATVIQGVKIGRWTTIGAGSVVTKDIPDNCLAVGVPCNPIRLDINKLHKGGVKHKQNNFHLVSLGLQGFTRQPSLHKTAA